MSNVTPFQFRRVGQDIRPSNGTSASECSSADDTAQERTFHFWCGASNRRYVHVVHSLLECPELTESNYILVQVDAAGRRTPLKISHTTSPHGSENLADIRRDAARLGACEVHLHAQPDDARAQAVTQWDLQASYFGDLTCEDSVAAERKIVRA